VRQHGRGARLSKKALTHGLVAREIRREQLDRHGPVEAHLPREIHESHAPATKQALDRELAGDGRLEQEEGLVGGITSAPAHRPGVLRYHRAHLRLPLCLSIYPAA
jgi:hypothetical protein